MLELQAKINMAALDPNATAKIPTGTSSMDDPFKASFAQSIIAKLDDPEFLKSLPSLKGFTR